MAENARYIDAPPEAVYDILADPETYADWVVGAYNIRAVEEGWPEPGSTFHHTQGQPPLTLKDTTTARWWDPPHGLAMDVRARPFMVARVEFRLQPVGRGTRIQMLEWPIGGIAGALKNPVLDFVIARRNDESLRRLARLAETRAKEGEEPEPTRRARRRSPAAATS